MFYFSMCRLLNLAQRTKCGHKMYITLNISDVPPFGKDFAPVTYHFLLFDSLYNCNLTTSGCLNLASVLCTNQTLKELALGHNEDLGVAGVQFLCQGLLCPSSKIHTLR